MADLHVEIDREAGGIAGQIARELRESVRCGRLDPGARLPASRDLARDLGVSRGVVVEAYEQLVAEGFLESRIGAGTRVAVTAGRSEREPSVIPPEASFAHRPTSPDLGAFPRRAWSAALRQVLATLPNDGLDYGDPGGVLELRVELAAYLRRVRAADVTPGDIVIVTGVAQGLSLLVTVLAQAKGRPIVLATESPTSARQEPLLRRAGADLVGVPVDDEGVDVQALTRTGAEAVLVTPAHHYPTGVVLSPRRRAELVAWAAATGATIMEDDYDAEFRFDRDPVGCLQGLAPGHVVFAGSVSKALAPGLRLGWLAAPPALARAVRLARAELDLGSPVIDQHTLAHFIRSGGYERHLRRMRREYRTRRDALVQALAEHFPDIRVRGISAGLHLYAELDDPAIFARSAQAHGLAAEVAGDGLAIGFARLPEHRIAAAVRAIAQKGGPWHARADQAGYGTG
ncbi:PLP-dependent aminotransferase family protein [Acrocarpospora macrocephala]|uniref:GntR family transcriptional regulator n=1 Tax=Acrocarpospora macrocephala TaxID=150177 RepID=A0A5M3WMF0_9ACTN|nr:PLP-dependent aminotransferase family protein [Acrocarpospora macrocephala]GES09232.1 GntR family transcriptional regulator [Acrocarpospora macrocephala]